MSGPTVGPSRTDPTDDGPEPLAEAPPEERFHTAEETLARLQKRVLAYGAVLAVPFALHGPWPSLAILTLTLTVAIVQLRWLASHVASLTALALDFTAAEEVGPGRRDSRQQDGEARESSPESTSPGRAPTFRSTDGSQPSSRPADPDTPKSRKASESCPPTHSPAAEQVAADHPESTGLSEDSSSASPESDGGSSPWRRRAALAALGRIPVLVGLVTVLVVVGGSHPWAIAAGLAPLPLALITEALAAARAG